jgi:signal transduction histidine kinase/DNA-binding response OmpR family regulator/ligand-binding sensor domain-containing protein
VLFVAKIFAFVPLRMYIVVITIVILKYSYKFAIGITPSLIAVNRLFNTISGLLLMLVIGAADAVAVTMPQQRVDLSNDHINAFAQDSLGFVWVGTANGLCKSYGKSYDLYFHDKNDPCTLTANNISGLTVGSDGTLWVATTKGVCARHPGCDGFSRYDISGDDASAETNMRGVVEYSDGLLAYGYNGLYAINVDDKTVAMRMRLDRRTIIGAAIDSLGYLWVAADSELLRLDRSLRVVSKLATGTTINAIASHGDKLLIATNSGVRVLDIDNHRLHAGPAECAGMVVNSIVPLGSDAVMICTANRGAMVWHEGRVPKVDHTYRNFNFGGLTSADITTAMMAADGNVWVGTFDSGLTLVTNRRQMFNNDRVLANLLRSRFVTRVSGDANGRLWIGTRYNGIISYDSTTGTSTHYAGENAAWLRDFSSDFVQELMCDSHKRLWVGYADALMVCDILPGGQLKLIKSWLHTGDVVTMAEDSAGRIWAGTADGGIYMVDTDLIRHRISASGSASANITCIIPLAPDKMLFSAYGDDIYMIDTGTLVLAPLDRRFKQEWNSAIDLYRDSQGRLWVGTYDKGLLRYDIKAKTLHRYTDFLSNDIVAVAEDRQRNIWVSSSYGIYRVDGQTGSISTYLQNNGIDGNQFHEKCHYRMPDGLIYFGGNSGIVELSPADAKTSRTKTPVHITDIMLLRGNETDTDGMGSDVAYTRTLTLDHHNNAVSLTFTGLSYSAPEYMEYAYCLKGLDDIWIYSGTHNNAVYSNLPPGHYTFMVKVKTSDGHWDDPVSLLDITVKRTPWLHPLALIAYAVILLLLIFVGNRLYLRAKVAKKRYALARMQVEQERRNTENKINFYNNISHELRTPLTMVYAPVKLLRNGISSMSQQQIDENLEFIDTNIDRLLRLTKQLLSFRNINDQSLPLQVGQYDVVAQLDNLVRIYNIYAAEKDITVRFVCPYTRLTVTYDSDKLDKIVNNLLFNATKYTPEHGHITLEASLIAAPEGASGTNSATWFEIRVIDDGIGVDSSSLSKIFDRFRRLVGADHRDKINGFGIGLNYVNHLVEMHKGIIRATRNAGKGMTFVVALPVAPDAYSLEEQAPAIDASEMSGEEMPESETVETKNDADTAERQRLLVVEDSAEMLKFIRDIFAERFDVTTATDGVEGLHMAIETGPDVIITDAMMPGMDGYSLISAIKADPNTSHVPVIMLTAKTSDEDRINSYRVGADMYISKPFNPNVLVSMVDGLLTRTERLRNAIMADAGRSTTPVNSDDLSPLDRQFLDKLYAYIEENMSNSDFNVNLLGREMGLSRTNLYRKIKALTGVTPIDLLRVCRLNRAAELLLSRQYSMLEISEMTGFGTQSHFSSLFKRHFGVPPREYNGQPPVQQ